jgi:hypothetical protein
MQATPGMLWDRQRCGTAVVSGNRREDPLPAAGDSNSFSVAVYQSRDLTAQGEAATGYLSLCLSTTKRPGDAQSRLWLENPKVELSSYQWLSLDTILSQLHPAPILTSYVRTIHFILLGFPFEPCLNEVGKLKI